jgi:hypothetical protein
MKIEELKIRDEKIILLKELMKGEKSWKKAKLFLSPLMNI